MVSGDKDDLRTVSTWPKTENKRFNRTQSHGDSQETTHEPGECWKVVTVLFPPIQRVAHHFNGVWSCVFFVTLNLLKPKRRERRVTVVYFSVCVHIEKLHGHLYGTDLLGKPCDINGDLVCHRDTSNHHFSEFRTSEDLLSWRCWGLRTGYYKCRGGQLRLILHYQFLTSVLHDQTHLLFLVFLDIIHRTWSCNRKGSMSGPQVSWDRISWNSVRPDWCPSRSSRSHNL